MWVPTDPAHGYTTVYTDADVDACIAQEGFDHYGTWIYYWEWTDPASTGYGSYSTQEHNADKISVHPFVVGPILYCVYILWHSSRSKHKQYGYSSATYSPEYLDWAAADDGSPPPNAGGQLYENDINFPPPQDELYCYSSVIKACVYTEKALEDAKAAVDSANPTSIREMLTGNQKYMPAPYWGYPEIDWMPGAPGKMQTKLTSLWLSHRYSEDGELYFADDYDDISIKTRPHTKAELQEAGMWPKEN